MSGRLPRLRWRLLRAVWGPRTVTGLWHGPVDPAARAQIRAAVGVYAAVGALVVLGVIHLLGTPPFDPPDETAHVGYAFSLLEWRIPHIADFPNDLPVPGMQPGLSLWTANHPPGAYAVMAIPLGLGEAAGVPLLGFWLARASNLLGVAVAVVLAARIAALILPERPRVVVGVAMLTALIPYYLHVGATAYSDGIALPFSLAIAAVSVEVLVLGPSRRRLLALMLLGALGALTRAPTAVLVLLSGVAWGVAVLRHDPAGLGRRLRRGVLGAAMIGLAAFVAAGWFYLGNLAIYGDPTGSDALFLLHDRDPRGTFWGIFTASRQYRFQELQQWSKLEGLPETFEYVVSGYFVLYAHKVTQAVLVLATLAAGVWVWRHRRQGPWGRVQAVALLVVWWFALFAMMALFVAQGGNPHARYVWPGIAGLALVLVVGLEVVRLPVGRLMRRLGRGSQRLTLPVGLLVLYGCLIWANVTGWPRALELWQIVPPRRDMAWATIEMLAGRQIPGAGWVGVVLMAALAATLMVLGWSLVATPGLLDRWWHDAARPARQPQDVDTDPVATDPDGDADDADNPAPVTAGTT